MKITQCARLASAAALLAATLCAQAQDAAPPAPPATATAEAPLSYVFRDTPIVELFEMIARKERINIVVGRGVSGNVAVNLYNLPVRQAIYAIAEAGGYTVTMRDNGYFINDPKSVRVQSAPGQMEVRSMQVLYSDPKAVGDILARHVGPGGSVTLVEGRRMLVVEDTPDGLKRIARLLQEVDSQPRQILIEAKILEITLDNSENFGIDWTKIFSANGVNRFGTTGLAARGTPGFIFNFVNDNVEVFLSALSNKGRVRTLATPRLLTMENQEAITNIGDKLGYKLTTTINNVTTESVQFLETGVILRVTPSVDGAGRIFMKIRPEVSSGSVSAGIPSKKTTEVSTQMVANNGQAILIAGLIKTSSNTRRMGIPVLGDIPGIGRLFSNNDEVGSKSETIVIITPRIVPATANGVDEESMRVLGEATTDPVVPTRAVLGTR
jgi:type II secretory pathway component GspD/PulD (secretin)